MPPLSVSCKTSMHIGKKWSAAHNRRTYDRQKWNRDGHIVAERSSLNVTLCDSDLRSWFHQTFDAAIAAFNEKNAGKHNDRLINPDAYYQEQKGRVQECIIQLGDHAAYLDMVSKVGQEIADDMHIRFLTEAYRQWSKENPSLRVFSAIIHMDETKDGTPHLHLDFVPVAESKRGLAVKVSMDGAMKALGFDRRKGQKYAETPYKQWLAAQRERIEALAAQYVDLIPSEHNTGKQHVETWEYKSEQARKQAVQLAADQKERAAEIERLEAEKQQLSAELEPLRELKVSTEEMKHTGRAALGHVTVKKKDFELLQAQAAAYRANQAEMADMAAAKKAFEKQRADELARIGKLKEDEEKRIAAARKQGYDDARSAIRQYEKAAAEKDQKAEAARQEAERMKTAETELYQETVRYREKLRAQEKATAAEYTRNRNALQLLERAEERNRQLEAQVSGLKAEIQHMEQKHGQEIRAMNAKLAGNQETYAQKLRESQEQHAQELRSMQRQLHEQQALGEQKVQEMQGKLDAAEANVSRLRKMLSAAADVIRDICCAIGMLNDYRGGEYRADRLSDEQDSLIDAVREIGSAFLEKLSFRQHARDAEKSIGISDPIREQVEENVDRRYNSLGGMSR